MAKMAEQMELFEPVERGFDEGGLMDEGGTVDPVSGNDVPPGSTKEEVRDDIPAQLSEGEFVFPADVVRYIGLENLMRMRQEAKQGLAQMEAMGQMGNSEEATMPDDLPFDMYDLDVEDDNNLKMQVGGFVNPQTGTYTVPGTGITGFQQAPGSTTGYNPNQPIQPYFQPVQFTQAQYQDPLQVTNIPTFADTVGSGFGQYDEMKTYVNSAGQTMQIPFKDGKPIYPIPEGYSEQGEVEETVTTTPVQQKVQTAKVVDDGGKDPDEGKGSASGTIAFGGTPATGRREGLVDNAFTANVSFTGFSLGDAYSAMQSGASSFLNSLSGGKFGQPMSLEKGQGAIISNIVDPSTKTGLSPAQTLDFSIALNAEQYNNMVVRPGPQKVTTRTELADITTQLAKINDSLKGEIIDYGRAKYLAESIKMGRADEIVDSIEKGKGLDKAIADALGRDRGKIPGSGILGTDFFAEEYSGPVSAAERSRMSDAEKAAVDAAMEAYAKSMATDDDEDDDDTAPSGPSAETVAEADAAGAIGYEGNQYDDDDSGSSSSDPSGMGGATGATDSFAKGGLAKQMKHSGLASKK